MKDQKRDTQIGFRTFFLIHAKLLQIQERLGGMSQSQVLAMLVSDKHAELGLPEPDVDPGE